VLIAWHYLDSVQCPGAVNRIGRSELEAFGAQALWFTKSGIRIARTRDSKGWRLWQPQVRLIMPEENEE